MQYGFYLMFLLSPPIPQRNNNPAAPPVLTSKFFAIFCTLAFQFDHHCRAQEEQQGLRQGQVWMK